MTEGENVAVVGHFVGGTYRVPEKDGSQVHEHLGHYFKRETDSLWSWTRERSRHHDDWRTGYGTEETEEKAKIKILEGWLTADEVTSQKLDIS